MLKTVLTQMLNANNDPDTGNSLSDRFFNNGLFQLLGKKGKAVPSYLNKMDFSAVLMAALDVDETAPEAKASLQKSIDNLPEGKTKSALQTLLNDVSGDIVAFKQRTEAWFDSMMERASGWYKRKLKYITLAISFVLVVATNADTISVIETLAADPEVTSAMVDYAAKATADGSVISKLVDEQRNQTAVATPTDSGSTAQTTTNTDSLIAALVIHTNNLDSLSGMINDMENITGMGWSKATFYCHGATGWDLFLCWLKRIFGWLLTTLAISLGAPFWFDLLKKLINIRGSGTKPPEKTPVPGTPE